MKKRLKGQITVFIIIGLVLLISVATFVYFYQKRVTAPIKKVVTVPEEVQQVYDYVVTCVDQIGKDGLTLLGAQGGYIELPPLIARNPNANVPADPFGVIKIPYWYYEGEDRRPTLEYMQRELSMYVKENLPACVGNFESFEDQYDISPLTGITPIVMYTDNEVIIEVKWTLDITIQERRVTLEEFVTSFPLKLKELWTLANTVMQQENEQAWFENITIDLMSMNPDIPVSGMEFRCGSRTWHLQEIRKELKDVLYYLMPAIRVENTQYLPPLESERVYNKLKEEAKEIREDLIAGKEPDWPGEPPEDVYEFNRMKWDLDTPRTDLRVTFQYDRSWPLLITAQPNQGGILRTSQMKGPRKYLRFLCMNEWHFAYDVIYPLKAILKDDTAFNGDGYTFQFAFPVIIEDNDENRKTFGMKRFQATDYGMEFCSTVGDRIVDVTAKGFVEGSVVAEELSGVNLTYQCLNRECPLGETFSDGTGSIHFEAYLPEGCSNPAIIAKKEGYLDARDYARERNLDLFLTRLKTLNYKIKVIPYTEQVDKDNPTKSTNEEWLDSMTYDTFTKTMYASISMSLTDGTLDQYKTYPAIFTTTYDQTVEAEDTMLNFVYDDAAYDIDIILFKGDTPVGGYHAENLTITYEELVGSDTVEFKVMEYRPLPAESHRQAGMFLFLYERGEKDGRPYAEALRPRFI